MPHSPRPPSRAPRSTRLVRPSTGDASPVGGPRSRARRRLRSSGRHSSVAGTCAERAPCWTAAPKPAHWTARRAWRGRSPSCSPGPAPSNLAAPGSSGRPSATRRGRAVLVDVSNGAAATLRPRPPAPRGSREGRPRQNPPTGPRVARGGLAAFTPPSPISSPASRRGRVRRPAGSARPPPSGKRSPRPDGCARRWRRLRDRPACAPP